MTNVTSYLLHVSEVINETEDACSIVFDVTPEQATALNYHPGQFLTLRIPSDRCGSVARCYSLSSSPCTDDALKVTVKRTADGYASQWICDNVTSETRIEVLPPSGIFTPETLDDDLIMFAAGSGITPVMSIIKSVLAKGSGRLTLIYANRDERSVIFASELAGLAAANPERLTIVHWLESVQGLPDMDQLRTLAKPFIDRTAFICGPREFMKAATSALKDLEVPKSRIHKEKFVSLGGNPFEQASPSAPDERSEGQQQGGAGDPASLTVQLDGEDHSFVWPRNQKLLDFLLEQGLDAPFSCREGACSACACMVTSGEVHMLNNDILEDADIEDGIRLACQSLPVTDEVNVTYDQ